MIFLHEQLNISGLISEDNFGEGCVSGRLRDLQVSFTHVRASLAPALLTEASISRFAEHELEESRLSLQQHRRAAASDVSELKQLMERNEKQLKREIDEANQACRDQKNQADKSMER